MTLELSVATPTSHKKYTIDWLECRATTGFMTILPGHAPVVCSLEPKSSITFELAGSSSRETIHLVDGIMYVNRHTITIVGT